MQKPKVSIYIAASIDGYIARPDGNIDWLLYGHSGDEDYGYKSFISSIDVVIMGKNTYEVVNNFDTWGYTGKRVIILSSTLIEVRPEAELYNGSLNELLERLYKEGAKHIWVDGGITASNFLEQGLVDELIISVIAKILGSGIPLFKLMSKETNCGLIASKSYPSGLVQLHYKVIHDNNNK
ncbi:5-amino-6-(5-phosphoribosylamino)uracil reductase [Candidatus Rubidus massiliensis]|nr:5-amino-6-(5-phosphoribosylamino)uracil reductase [Candidatus Rubidus massiliensis]